MTKDIVSKFVESKGFTAEQTMEALGINDYFYGKIVKDYRKIPIEYVTKFMEIFDMTIVDVITELNLLTLKDIQILQSPLTDSNNRAKALKSKRFTERMQALRKANNYKQWEVATAIGMTRAGYNHHERLDGKLLSTKRLTQVSKLFKVSIDDLIRPKHSVLTIDENFLEWKIAKAVYGFLSLKVKNRNAEDNTETRNRLGYETALKGMESYCKEQAEKILFSEEKRAYKDINNTPKDKTLFESLSKRKLSFLHRLYDLELLTYVDILELKYKFGRPINLSTKDNFSEGITSRIERIIEGQPSLTEGEITELMAEYEEYRGSDIYSLIEYAFRFNVSIDELLSNTLVLTVFDDDYLEERIEKMMVNLMQRGYNFRGDKFPQYLYSSVLIGIPEIIWTPEVNNNDHIR